MPVDARRKQARVFGGFGDDIISVLDTHVEAMRAEHLPKAGSAQFRDVTTRSINMSYLASPTLGEPMVSTCVGKPKDSAMSRHASWARAPPKLWPVHTTVGLTIPVVAVTILGVYSGFRAAMTVANPAFN